MILKYLKFGLLVSLSFSPIHEARAFDSSEMWSKMEPYFARTLPKLQEAAAAGNRKTFLGWSTSLSETKQNLREQIDTIMADAKATLGTSELVALKAQVNLLQDEIKRLHAKQTNLSNRELSAPVSKSGYQIWVTTRADIERQIKAIDTTIEEKKQAINAARQKMIDDLLQMKAETQTVENVAKQIDNLLYTVNGDDDLVLISAYQNVRELTLSLEGFIQNSPTVAAKQEYFGMYALLIRALLPIHQDYITKVEAWRARLSVAEKKSETWIADSRTILLELQQKNSDPVSIKQAMDNIQMNQRIINLENRYEQYLSQSEDRVKAAIETLNVKYEVAENTYNTFQNFVDAINLVQEIHETEQKSFDLELPKMAAFDDALDLEALEKLNSMILK